MLVHFENDIGSRASVNFIGVCNRLKDIDAKIHNNKKGLQNATLLLCSGGRRTYVRRGEYEPGELPTLDVF
jgi:hypothetical protein